MRLRQRMLLLFGVFAVAPLLGIGVWDYLHSVRAIDDLVGAQSDLLAERAAVALQGRLDLQESDIALLSGNAETQRVLRSAGGNGTGTAGRAEFEAYLNQLWESLRPGYLRVSLVDKAGHVILNIEEPGARDPFRTNLASAIALTRPVLDSETGASIGHLQLWPRSGELFGTPPFRDKFGGRGWMHVLDRGAGTVLESAASVPAGGAPEAVQLAALEWTESRGRRVFQVGAERRVASFVSLPSPAWTVVATASVDEFAAPFVKQRLFDLGLLLLVVLTVSLGFYLWLRRSTRSLDVLAAAAGQMGQGDFSPALPPSGHDEVGRLSAAFRTMADRVREMIAQVESSRQTAVLGRFATELAHEIRNPLTSIKLHLQGLERDARAGRIPEESAGSVGMALREIHRLDQAVRTALRSGRPVVLARPYALHRILEEAVRLLQPEAAANRVRFEVRIAAPRDMVVGDPEATKGALMNLMLNAIQAMPDGGVVVAGTGNLSQNGTEAIEVRVTDEGPGIPEALSERVFQPFFTTREGGTGLGLPMARDAILAHGGSLVVRNGPERGAEVVMRIPLAPVAAV